MPVERTLIADAITQVQKSIRFANWMFWGNFLFSALNFTTQHPMFGFLNAGVALWMWFDIRKGHEAIEALNELKRRGYRAV